MATSSIFHNFVIEGEENVRRFIDAFDKSLEVADPTIEYTGRVLTDPQEIKEVLARMHAKFEAEELEAMKNVG